MRHRGHRTATIFVLFQFGGVVRYWVVKFDNTITLVELDTHYSRVPFRLLLFAIEYLLILIAMSIVV